MMDTPISPDTTVPFSDPTLPTKMPPSSPRLPSPPPPTEIQIGPKSPSLGPEQSTIEANAGRRIHPGTKAADMAAGPPLVSLNELDSAFQLQEHLSSLHHHHTRTPSSTTSTPITRATALLLASPPSPTIDRTLWLYELTRLLIQQCNSLLIGFLFDTPPCSALTCPEMRASEWQFLCAVHEQPKSCCAIDYCCHTLDWAGNIVTSQKIFPSRLSISGGGGGGGGGEKGADEGKGGMQGMGLKHLVNIFRRLHRIFAHAWFQHRGVFWEVENREGLYVLFKTVCDVYELLPAENYKLPPEAEGLESESGSEEGREGETPVAPTGILKREDRLGTEEGDEVFNAPGGVGRTNTRRHVRQTPSVGSAVTTVLEADEEEGGGDVTSRLSNLNLDTPIEKPNNEAEEGEAEVPVIVDTYRGGDLQEQAQESIFTRQDSVPGGLEEMAAQQAGEGEVEGDADADADATVSSGSEWDGMSFDTPEGSSPDDAPEKQGTEKVVEGTAPKHVETERQGEIEVSLEMKKEEENGKEEVRPELEQERKEKVADV